MGRKKKQKKFNKTKAMKRVARDMFMDIPMDTKVHKVKKKYNRKKVPKMKISTLTPSIATEPKLSANYFFKLY